ncbi:hypothetical protein GCM10017673_26040 [Streptosporangium violaceochromogenes]|nr:hypothetical protein GCM10017673_26040 [Streptosporangium violaceochromogenes]
MGAGRGLKGVRAPDLTSTKIEVLGFVCAVARNDAGVTAARESGASGRRRTPIGGCEGAGKPGTTPM